MDPQARRSFGTLVAAAFVDGTLSDEERLVLSRKATEFAIPLGVMNDLIDQGRQGKLPITIPSSREAKEALLDDLMDVTCSDGRIEQPEHHLLAKFASHLGIALPDLRARVRQRMERRPARPPARIEPRIAPPPRESRVEPKTKSPEPPAPPGMSAPPPGPVRLEEVRIGAAPSGPGGILEKIPPVTLQLLKQAIMFESPADALRYVERTMGVTRPEADELVRALLAAYPELKPGSHQIKSAPRRP
jgi:uncharacterized tellurite resistance protein B-like protein